MFQIFLSFKGTVFTIDFSMFNIGSYTFKSDGKTNRNERLCPLMYWVGYP